MPLVRNVFRVGAGWGPEVSILWPPLHEFGIIPPPPLMSTFFSKESTLSSHRGHFTRTLDSYQTLCCFGWHHFQRKISGQSEAFICLNKHAYCHGSFETREPFYLYNSVQSAPKGHLTVHAGHL